MSNDHRKSIDMRTYLSQHYKNYDKVSEDALKHRLKKHFGEKNDAEVISWQLGKSRTHPKDFKTSKSSEN